MPRAAFHCEPDVDSIGGEFVALLITCDQANGHYITLLHSYNQKPLFKISSRRQSRVQQERVPRYQWNVAVTSCKRRIEALLLLNTPFTIHRTSPARAKRTQIDHEQQPKTARSHATNTKISYFIVKKKSRHLPLSKDGIPEITTVKQLSNARTPLLSSYVFVIH